MDTKQYKRFYVISIAVLLALSAYPLINGARMAVLSIRNGLLEPEQYAKYVVPYTAICVSLILFASFQPLLWKLKRFSFPAGLTAAYGVFFAVELCLERIQVNTFGMTRVDPSTLTPSMGTVAPTIDIWQAALCYISPNVKTQSAAFVSDSGFYYILDNNFFKLHYYLISLILITMTCGLVYGIGKRFRVGGDAKPLVLRGIATAALVALCVFANTTAFFRQAEPIQTPLASMLTCLFFVLLGASAGVYAGSYLLGKKALPGMGLPVLTAVLTTAAMYIGEAVMMDGNLYRFGTGWFFKGLPGIALAPADILVNLLSGGLAWLTLFIARNHQTWPGKRTAVIVVTLSTIVALSGIALTMTAPEAPPEDELFGCYEFDVCLYMNPLSSFYIPVGGSLPYVYALSGDTFIRANPSSGDIERFDAYIERTPISIDDFPQVAVSLERASPVLLILTQYKERYLLATLSGGNRLYLMDDELWLVGVNDKTGLWSVYRLKKTDKTTFTELESVFLEQQSRKNSRQMTLGDLYAFARLGGTLTHLDLEPFAYKLTGDDFSVRRYDVEYALVVTVRTSSDGKTLESVRLMSPRTLDEEETIDLREVFDAVVAYLNPLRAWEDITIEDTYGGAEERELVYDYDYDRCRYYISTTRADSIFVVFPNGERLPLKQALEERRVIVDEVAAHGLNIFSIPTENPLGGEFLPLNHLHIFSLNGEVFYPSKTFMYAVSDDGVGVYFDVQELIDFLLWYGYNDKAEALQTLQNTSNLPVVANRAYIRDTDLAEIGIEVSVGWVLSSHTPVDFTFVFRG